MVGEPYLHPWLISAFLSGQASGCLNGHVEIVLIGHGDHVAIVLDLDLEVLAEAELLADRLHKFAHRCAGRDENVASVTSVYLDPDLTNTPAAGRRGSRTSRRSFPRLGTRNHLKVGIVEIASVVVIFVLLVNVGGPRILSLTGSGSVRWTIRAGLVIVIHIVGIVIVTIFRPTAAGSVVAAVIATIVPTIIPAVITTISVAHRVLSLRSFRCRSLRRPALRWFLFSVESSAAEVERLRLWSSATDRLGTAHRSTAGALLACRSPVVRLWRGRRREHVAVHGWLRLLSCSALKVRLDQVGGGKRELLLGAVVLGRVGHLLDFGTGESSEGILPVGCRNETCLSQVVLGFQVLDFGVVGAVDDAYGNGENGVALNG